MQRAAGIDDPSLRLLYGAVYAAFRRRRSLLLLDLAHQVRLEELPWVRAIEGLRRAGSDATAALRPEFAGAEGVQRLRHRLGVRPVYKTVDTCAAEFEAKTPYHYSTYELDPAAESEVAPQTERDKVIILGSGPNRIGQGIEFDYSCVHAALTPQPTHDARTMFSPRCA